jgi:hypothetical protein
MNKTNSIEKSSQWGSWYGVVMLLVLMKGMGYQILELIQYSTIGEMLVVGVVFWILGGVFVWIFLYQYQLSKTYTEFYRRLVNIFVVLTVIVFTTEIFDFYWNAVHEKSKFYSCILSGLFFSPIFIGLTLILQKTYSYLKRGHEISYQNRKN